MSIIKTALMRLGVLYDPSWGNQVPEVIHSVSSKPKHKGDPAPPPVWEDKKTKTGDVFYQRPSDDGGVLSYEISSTGLDQPVKRTPTLTQWDKKEILERVKSINWDTARTIKKTWSKFEGEYDSKVVEALKGQFSSRTVRGFTRCFNAALSQEEGSGKGKGLQSLAKSA